MNPFIQRRTLLRAALATAATGGLSVQAQTAWPAKAVTLIVRLLGAEAEAKETIRELARITRQHYTRHW